MDDRGKQEKKKIEDKATWQVTFSRRKKGLIKKAYELSVLCDIDIALIMFSPSGRLTQFSGIKRCMLPLINSSLQSFNSTCSSLLLIFLSS